MNAGGASRERSTVRSRGLSGVGSVAGTMQAGLSRGTNLLQLSRPLGHHSAAFTLSRFTRIYCLATRHPR
jgi:hypothetical protein